MPAGSMHAPDAAATTTAQLRGLIAMLGRLDVDVPDAELVERIRALEELKAAAAAAQARTTTAFVTAQEQAQRRTWRPRRRLVIATAAEPPTHPGTSSRRRVGVPATTSATSTWSSQPETTSHEPCANP